MKYLFGQYVTITLGFIAATPVYYMAKQSLNEGTSVWWACALGWTAWLVVTTLLDIRFRS